MKIAYVAAGAAGMYCGTCLHDNTVAKALMDLGHEVTLIPTYTPLRTDEEDVSVRRIFYGAINVYLQQKSSLFHKTPRALDRVFDSRGLLNQVSRFSSSTDAHELGALTLSVLRGEEGRQTKELEKLVDFLTGLEPDVVHLTNSMFLGFSREIKKALDVPVVCGLTGEDIFLEELDEPWRTRVHDEMKLRARDADGFVATSHYYADHMADFLDMPRDKIHVVHLGLPLGNITPREDGYDPDAPFVIGYLARITPAKGLRLLVDAFREAYEESEGGVRLKVAGYVGPRDRHYLEEQKDKAIAWNVSHAVDFVGEVEWEDKLAFLRSLDVLSVPTVYREPKGRFAFEALAHAVPVVLPDHGAFPEILEATGGGLLFRPESTEALAMTLLDLQRDPERARALGRAGRAAVLERFDDRTLAEATLEVYRGVV